MSDPYRDALVEACERAYLWHSTECVGHDWADRLKGCDCGFDEYLDRVFEGRFCMVRDLLAGRPPK
jgi:hypothetical protein